MLESGKHGAAVAGGGMSWWSDGVFFMVFLGCLGGLNVVCLCSFSHNVVLLECRSVLHLQGRRAVLAPCLCVPCFALERLFCNAATAFYLS